VIEGGEVRPTIALDLVPIDPGEARGGRIEHARAGEGGEIDERSRRVSCGGEGL
jgi:hypothetical protein